MSRPDHVRLRRRGKRGSAGCPRPIHPAASAAVRSRHGFGAPARQGGFGGLRALVGAQRPKPGSCKAFCGPPSRCRDPQHSSKRGWTGRPGDRARAANPNRRCALRVQTGVEVLLGVHVLACFGLVDLDGLIVVDVLRGRGAGGGALTRGRFERTALGGRIVTVRPLDRALELGQRRRLRSRFDRAESQAPVHSHTCRAQLPLAILADDDVHLAGALGIGVVVVVSVEHQHTVRIRLDLA